MKKLLLFAIIALMGTLSADAAKKPKTEPGVNPRGLFLMQKISYEDGSKAIIPPFTQYKFCGENLTMQVQVQPFTDKHVAFVMSNNDKVILNHTGFQKKSKAIQIFNTSDDAFTLRWFNDRLPNNTFFPYNAYSQELYTKENISNDMAEAFNALQGKYDAKYNKFTGVWKRRGIVEKAGDVSKVYGIDNMYKIYTPDKVMIVYGVSDKAGAECAACEMVGVKYYDDTMIKEMFGNGSPCIISWIDSSTFTLTYLRQGRAITEVWDRSGLPECFQTLFNTNDPITNKVADQMINK